uniref:transposase domain-containing protein n=1 Tax=Teredinibacter franksiae TaxID=2761453 RepID=UPI00162805B2
MCQVIGCPYIVIVIVIVYSLIETAKANDLNTYDYLQHIFKELPNVQNVEQIEALLPWNVQLG